MHVDGELVLDLTLVKCMRTHEDRRISPMKIGKNIILSYPIYSCEPQRRSRWVSSLKLGMLWNKQLSLMTHVTQRSRRQSCIITRVESSGHAKCYTTTTWTKAAMLQFDEIAQAPKAPFGYTDSYLITNNRCSTIPTTRDRICFMVGFSKR